ncbi:mTERF [Musa troglodytarum]|uniref:mTERF n=1 Tax=Musa troglodytarum TaxID=320322 RepID=A0A9E7GRM7_9LILI|nr:mTERF [Musa troglodytarum]
MTDQKHSVVEFFEEKGFDDESMNRMMRAREHRKGKSWDYLGSIEIQKRRLPYDVSKCLKILTLCFNQKLVPTVRCLAILGSKPGEVVKFPHIFSHTLEEKLCPLLLAFFRMLGTSEKQLVSTNPWNPNIRFLVVDMGREVHEIVEYPEFFQHGIEKSLEFRHKLLKQKSIHCSLSEMLSCNQKKFIAKYGLAAGFS